MFAKTTKSQPLTPWKILLGVLCIALVLISGTLAATHNHQHDADTHGSCSLCATAHTVAQVTQSPTLVILTQVYQIVEPGIAVARPRTVSITRHFTRPPPASARS